MCPIHVRHKAPTCLAHERQLILACPQFRSGVNLARIVRLAGCAGIRRILACGQTRIDPRIARDAANYVEVVRCRSLAGRLRKLRDESYRIVALEQSDQSQCLYDFQFVRKTALVIGHERLGVGDAELALVDDVIEIPVYGQPASYNVVTATTMAVYEYCSQFREG
jgi:tRNA G18 (ribose-2'-O)-methylase SpoU